ncbi:MAG: diaminopimelate decarboxylase, partial [Candidatus Eisenbacteria bacterium]
AYVYDLDAVLTRATRLRDAFAAIKGSVAYAVKANALHALLEPLAALGIGGEAGSIGELEAVRDAGFAAGRRWLNGNGRTREEVEWVARNGVAAINADHVAELDLIERVAAAQNTRIRVALRINPGITAPVHRYISTGDDEAKFGVSPAEALEAWANRARWPHLTVDGVHLHIGSQLMDPAPLLAAFEAGLELIDVSARRGAPLALFNLGGGFGIDYDGGGHEFPLESYAKRLGLRLQGRGLELVVEPGRWVVASAGVLVAEVLWVKRRGERRFVVLAAGMNDLIRPALYQARHRIVPVRPREGELSPATVVGPVCESADVFAEDALLPPLEPGDLVAILDAGAYGAAMASNYNGRGRLAELVVSGGRLIRARAGETPRELVERRTRDELPLG